MASRAYRHRRSQGGCGGGGAPLGRRKKFWA